MKLARDSLLRESLKLERCISGSPIHTLKVLGVTGKTGRSSWVLTAALNPLHTSKIAAFTARVNLVLIYVMYIVNLKELEYSIDSMAQKFAFNVKYEQHIEFFDGAY